MAQSVQFNSAGVFGGSCLERRFNRQSQCQRQQICKRADVWREMRRDNRRIQRPFEQLSLQRARAVTASNFQPEPASPEQVRTIARASLARAKRLPAFKVFKEGRVCRTEFERDGKASGANIHDLTIQVDSSVNKAATAGGGDNTFTDRITGTDGGGGSIGGSIIPLENPPAIGYLAFGPTYPCTAGQMTAASAAFHLRWRWRIYEPWLPLLKLSERPLQSSAPERKLI